MFFFYFKIAFHTKFFLLSCSSKYKPTSNNWKISFNGEIKKSPYSKMKLRHYNHFLEQYYLIGTEWRIYALVINHH